MTSLGESLGIALRESANLGRNWSSLWGKWSESKTSRSLEATVLEFRVAVTIISLIMVHLTEWLGLGIGNISFRAHM